MKFEKVAKAPDLKDGEMKTVKVGDGEVLLCRIDGEFFALSATCTHYGAPLEKGVLSGDRIICPWHHACFNAKTGELQEPPALDALIAFVVKAEGENILVSVPDETNGHEVPVMNTYVPQADEKTFAIIGAGAAGYAAAQAMRESGFEGRIVMITGENRLPYDRPNLSKAYLQGEAEAEWMPLRSEDFYKKYGIEFIANKKVTSLDADSKTVVLHTGETQRYDAILIATGGKAKTPDVPGIELKNVFTLRSYADSDKIIAACEQVSKVVVVGASFIGMETAFSLSKRGLDVTIVAPQQVPFGKQFGKEIGQLFQKLHEKNGTKFKLNTGVTQFEGNGSVKKVVLDNGEMLDADVVIVGIGVEPATEFVHGLNLNDDGSVEVDEHFRAADNIYAAGDIASFPDWRTGKRTRIEHWRTAEQQGRIAGRNMAGKTTSYRGVPFFWTKQAGLNFRYIGHADEWDDIITQGDISSQDFISFYVKDGTVLAAAGTGRDREMAAAEELMRLKKMPKPETLRSGKTRILEII